jgi:hypothetical protein
MTRYKSFGGMTTSPIPHQRAIRNVERGSMGMMGQQKQKYSQQRLPPRPQQLPSQSQYFNGNYSEPYSQPSQPSQPYSQPSQPYSQPSQPYSQPYSEPYSNSPTHLTQPSNQTSVMGIMGRAMSGGKTPIGVQYGQYPPTPSYREPYDPSGMGTSGMGKSIPQYLIPNSPNFNYSPQQNCRLISEHIKHCPVCCKIYKRDSNLLITIIVILLLFIVVLLTKLADK